MQRAVTRQSDRRKHRPASLGVPCDPYEETPLAAAPASAWSLINLILAVLTGAAGLGMLLSYFRKNEEDEKSRKAKFFGLIPAVAAVVTFLLTQDMGGVMQMVDNWTVLMGVLTAANVALAVVTKGKKTESKDA